MIRRLLGNKVNEGESNQMANVFHTKCLVKGNTCSLIIGGGSCTSVASTRLVSKLELETTPLHKPCKLQWLSENVEMFVNKQVKVCLKIGKYEDYILYERGSK